MLDNFDHIKAYWIMLGIGTAQTALAYGADDLDGTVRHELIYHDAGATTPEVLSVEEIRRLIVEAGREPVERDTLYHRVVRDGTKWEMRSCWQLGSLIPRRPSQAIFRTERVPCLPLAQACSRGTRREHGTSHALSHVAQFQ